MTITEVIKNAFVQGQAAKYDEKVKKKFFNRIPQLISDTVDVQDGTSGRVLKETILDGDEMLQIFTDGSWIVFVNEGPIVVTDENSNIYSNSILDKIETLSSNKRIEEL